jgi:flagellar hook-associated protein 3 FlgL
MTITSLGDLAGAFIMRRQSAESKAQIQTLSSELVTGVAQDKGAHLSGYLASLAGIENSLAQLGGYRNAARDLGQMAAAMQIALEVIGSQGTDLSATLLVAPSSLSEGRLASAGEDAATRLGTVVSALNTRFGDRSLFAGVATNQPAMVGASDLLDLLGGVVAGATSVLDAETLVSDWFADPDGFAALAYLGADAQGSVGIAAGETAQLGVTVMDPAVQDLLKALVMPALMSRGLLDGQPVARAELAKRAGEHLLEGQTSFVELRARLGTTEAQLDAAVTRNGAESSALELARADLIGVDPFETATRLEATQTQLETIYALTARMQRLNLVDYL